MKKVYEDYSKITMKSKRKYHSEKLLQFKVTQEKTWLVMKEVIGKYELIHSTLPHKIVINKNVVIEEKQNANAFNNFFINWSETSR